MPSYNCWTLHGDFGIAMEEDDEENENIPNWAQYGGFADTTGDGGGAVEENNGADDLGQILCDIKKDCESDKEVQKLECMLVDHKMLLYPGYEQGAQKVGHHAGIAAMEGMALLTRHLASY